MSTEADFIPKRRLLLSVTNAQTPTLTTSEDHEYNVGDIIRINVPLSYGIQIQYEVATILSIPSSTTMVVDFDTSRLNAFVVPAAPYTPAQVVPISGQSTDNIAR